MKRSLLDRIRLFIWFCKYPNGEDTPPGAFVMKKHFSICEAWKDAEVLGSGYLQSGDSRKRKEIG